MPAIKALISKSKLRLTASPQSPVPAGSYAFARASPPYDWSAVCRKGAALARACPGELDARQCHKLGLLPPPTKPRPAGVWSLINLPEAGKPAAGWGRGGEGRGVFASLPRRQTHTLDPTHQPL